MDIIEPMLTEIGVKVGLENMYVMSPPSREFPTAEKVTYHSQMTEFPPEWMYVARRTCGITSAAMAASLADPDITPMQVLIQASKLHKVPPGKQNYWLNTTWQGQEVSIPKGQTPVDEIPPGFTLTTNSVEPNPEGKYNPVFSIDNGYDHRGSKELFLTFNQHAHPVGDRDNHASVEEVITTAVNGYVLMLSVRNSLTPWLEKYQFSGPASHIVLLTDIVEMQGQSWYHLLDPYSPNGEKVQVLRPATSFHNREFSGFGTAIKI